MSIKRTRIDLADVVPDLRRRVELHALDFTRRPELVGDFLDAIAEAGRQHRIALGGQLGNAMRALCRDEPGPALEAARRAEKMVVAEKAA